MNYVPFESRKPRIQGGINTDSMVMAIRLVHNLFTPEQYDQTKKIMVNFRLQYAIEFNVKIRYR